MRIRHVLVAAVAIFLLVGCQKPQAAPLRIETAWVESAGEKTTLAVDRDGNYTVLVDNRGILVMTFSRIPALKDIEGLFGADLTYHLVDREVQIVLLPGIERLSLPSKLTNPATINLSFYYTAPAGRNLQVTGVEMFMAERQLQGTHNGPFTIIGEGSVEVIFSNGLNPEIAAIVTQGRVQSHSPERLWFALKPGVGEITISDRIRDIDGNRLAESLTYQFVYIEAVDPEQTISLRPYNYQWLELGYTGSVGYDTPLLLTVHWAFPQDQIERHIKQSLQGADYDLQWLNAGQLMLTIRSTARPHICLSFGGITDNYGYRHLEEQFLTYYFDLKRPQKIKAINLRDGTHVEVPLPFAIDGGVKISEDFSEAVLYRVGWQSAPGGGSQVRRELIVELATGLIKEGQVKNLGMHNYPFTSPWEAWNEVSHLLPKGSYPLAAGLSPSGEQVAIIRYSNSHMLLEIYKGGKLARTLPVKLYASYVEPAQLIAWSYNEDTVYYYSAYPDKDPAIVSMSLNSGEERYLALSGHVISPSLPSGHILIQGGTGYGFYLVAPDGTATKLSAGGVAVHIGAVIDQDHFVLNLAGDCYLCDLLSNTRTFISNGTAFAYDAVNQRVFVIEATR